MGRLKARLLASSTHRCNRYCERRRGMAGLTAGRFVYGWDGLLSGRSRDDLLQFLHASGWSGVHRRQQSVPAYPHSAAFAPFTAHRICTELDSLAGRVLSDRRARASSDTSHAPFGECALSDLGTCPHRLIQTSNLPADKALKLSTNCHGDKHVRKRRRLSSV